MTKQQAFKEFLAMFTPPPWYRINNQGKEYLDVPMRAEAWNNYTDSLCKDGQITTKQYETWTHPWK